MKVHEIKVPFHYWSRGEDCGYSPGCSKEISEEPCGHGFEGEILWREKISYHADEWGLMVINEIQRVSIPGYEDRIFYTRQWRDPEGNEFGKKDLRCKGSRAFALMLKGWRHSFYMNGELVNKQHTRQTVLAHN